MKPRGYGHLPSPIPSLSPRGLFNKTHLLSLPALSSESSPHEYLPSLTLGVPHSNYKPRYLSTTLAAPTFSRGLCHVCVASRYFSANHRSLSCQRSPCPVFCVLPDYQSNSGAYFDKDRGISTHGPLDITLSLITPSSMDHVVSSIFDNRYSTDPTSISSLHRESTSWPSDGAITGTQREEARADPVPDSAAPNLPVSQQPPL